MSKQSNETQRDILARLHEGLSARRTPQEVAGDLVALGAGAWLSAELAQELNELGAHPSSYMRRTWARHPGLERPYEAARAALSAVAESAAEGAGLELPGVADAQDARALQNWCAQACALLGLTGPVQAAGAPNGSRLKTLTYASYWNDGEEESYTYPMRPRGARGESLGHVDARGALSAAERRAALPGVSVRTYRRAVKAVLHLQQRAGVMAARQDLEFATRLGKARLAGMIELEEFCADAPTAAFVSYYTARLGMRTLFTSGAQDRPMDTLAEALLSAALASPSCAPQVLAAVITRQSVLRRLSATQKGALLGTYFEAMGRLARALESVFDPQRERASMTVRRGDDSSTWNACTRAYNQARTGWLNLLVGLELDTDVLERLLPGKIPALVASDVAFWHASEGGDTHADLAVWASLPLPWEVIQGRAVCTRSEIEAACAAAGIDAATTGWSQPYRQATIETPAVAPELVHGIVVASPQLAQLLRNSGVFSGQYLDTTRLWAGLDQLIEDELIESE